MEDAQELLLAMSLAARDEARKSLGEEGREVLDMMDLVSRSQEGPGSIVDVWVEARATSKLSEHDKDILLAYVARMSLIEHFDKGQDD